MIASIDATSRGSAGWDVELSGIRSSSTKFKHLHRGVVPGNPANSATSQGARPPEKHIFVSRLAAPLANLLSAFGKWKGRRVMKNISVIHSQRVLDIHGTFAFDARAAITRQSEATFDRLFQPLVDAGEVFFLRFPPHLFIISHKKVPWRVHYEELHSVKVFYALLS